MKARLVFAGLILLALTSCGVKKVPQDYSTFFRLQPKSILVVPPINDSIQLSASDYYFSTITIPLAERGYYVFPVSLTKEKLEELGFHDAPQVHKLPPQKLKELFGCDAILYSEILKWEVDFSYGVYSESASISYKLKDAETGTLLWNDTKTVLRQVNMNQAGAGCLGTLVASTVAAALTSPEDYLPLCSITNFRATWGVKQDDWNTLRIGSNVIGEGVPFGPYHKNYGRDRNEYLIKPF